MKKLIIFCLILLVKNTIGFYNNPNKKKILRLAPKTINHITDFSLIIKSYCNYTKLYNKTIEKIIQ